MAIFRSKKGIAISKKTPCDYCEYFPICRYEKNEFYEIKNLNKKEDIFKKMKEMEGECFE